MSRARLLALVVFAAVGLAVPLGAQLAPVPASPQGRDPGVPVRDPSQPQVRQVPVGNGVISGTITAADTGRPVRGARVMLTGIAGQRGGLGPATGGPLTTQFGSTVGAIPGGVAGGVAISGPVPTQTTILTGRGGVAGAGGVTVSVNRTVMTDAQGAFTIGQLPAGQFSLTVSRNQFLPLNYGQKRPGGQGTQIQLNDGQQMRLAVKMQRGGVITGTIFGEDGEPLSNVQVRASRYVMNNGIRRLQTNGGTSTDDRGIYRLSNLQPGDYIIAATANPSDIVMNDRMMADSAAIAAAVASGSVQPPVAPGMPSTVALPVMPPQQGPIEAPPGYLPTYYPGTPVTTNATAVHVDAGEERQGVDVHVQLVQASNITGVITTPPPSNAVVQVSLMAEDPGADMMGTPSARADKDGKFTLRNVSPGKYIIFAQTTPAPQPMTIVNGIPTPPSPGAPPRLDDSQKLWGRAAVTVDGQSNPAVSIALQPGRSISGLVMFDMAQPPDMTRARMSVTLTPAPAAQTLPMFQGPPQVQVGTDGRFTMTGVLPGKYFLRAGGTMKSAVVGGEDTLDFPLEITGDRDITDAVLTITDKISELSGTLVDAAGQPAVDYTIIAVAADARFWTPGSRRILTSRPGTDGRYMFRNLPPGDYLVAAVTDIEAGGQYDPEFLRSLAGASMRVSIGEGAKLSQNLRVAR